MTKSALVGAAPLLLFLIPMTALMWMCQSIPREKASPKLALPAAVLANAAEDDLECDWEDSDQDF